MGNKLSRFWVVEKPGQSREKGFEAATKKVKNTITPLCAEHCESESLRALLIAQEEKQEKAFLKNRVQTDLPPGWEARTDPRDRVRTFYVNHNTETSTWKKPEPVHLDASREARFAELRKKLVAEFGE